MLDLMTDTSGEGQDISGNRKSEKDPSKRKQDSQGRPAWNPREEDLHEKSVTRPPEDKYA